MSDLRTARQPDIVIRNGSIVDGSGGEPFIADVAIADGLIVGVGSVAAAGRTEIDAQGKIVTPGFVDIHTHYDGQAIWSDTLSPSSSHGVTTVVLGNCGVGFAPCRADDHDTLIRVMEGVEDIPGVVMAEGLSWSWETFPQYLDALAARPRDIDVAAYLPHSPLRVYVMGERGARREAADADDLAQMRALAREAAEAGALGFATSRVMVHRTADGEFIPSYDAAREEIEAIGAGLVDGGGGILQFVAELPGADGWAPEIERLTAIARQTRLPITFTFGAANNGPQIWRQALDQLDAAQAEGLRIAAQVYPRPVGMILGFDLSVNPFSLTEAYLSLAKLPLVEKVARLRDPEMRAKILSEKPADGHPIVMMSRNFDWMFPLGHEPNYEPSPEDSIASQARAAGKTPEEFAYDCLLGDDGRAMLLLALGNFPDASLDQLGEIMRDENVVLGLGDGGAHYGMICDASYPTYLLAHWTRDRKGERLSVAEAVKALAADPAKVVGLHDRGHVAVGYKADLNVIDIDRLTLHRPTVVFDLPGGGRRLNQTASGYAATIVNGEIIAMDDNPTHVLPGRLVRGAQAAPGEGRAQVTGGRTSRERPEGGVG